MNRRRAATFGVAALIGLVPWPARAHPEFAVHALSVLDRVEPAVPGVSFQVVQITQAVLVATNHTDRPLVILGSHGEPFLRIAHRRVEMNVESPLTYTSGDPTGERSAVPDGLKPNGPANWRLVEEARSWSWFDPRIRFAPGRTTWSIDAQVGDDLIAVTGSFEPLEGHGHFKTALEDPPSIPDLELRLIDGSVPAFYIDNETGSTLAVTGRHGEPFLRIGPRGVVANTRSPDYYLGGNQTIRPVPKSADPDAEPRWEKLSTVPIWTWLEFRARLPASLHERSRLGAETRVVLTWTSPMTLGGDALDLHGHVRWIPPIRPVATTTTDGESFPWAGAVAAGAVLAVAAALGRGRRTR